MVFVPSSVPFRADRINDNRVYSDESIMDRERETWREYCASLFRKGVAPFPSDVAVSPLTGLRRNGRCLEVDHIDMVYPEYVVDVCEIDHATTLVSDEDDDAPETVLPIPIGKGL